MVPEGWKISTLGDVCGNNLQTGPFGSQLHANEYEADGVPVLMPKDLNGFRADTSSAAKISVERARDLSKHQLSKGDILFSRRGDVTRFALIDETSAGSLCGTGCLKATPGEQHSPEFLSYFLQKHWVRKWLEQNAVGQTMPNMNTAILSELPLMVAGSRQEEDTIAQILSTWDQAVTATERLLENSQQRKKGLMQQLLTGKKRLPGFEGEWEETPLGNLFAERSEIGVESLPLLSITSADGVVYQDETGRKDTSNADKSKYKRICPGDIGYNTMRMWQGRSSLSDKDGVVSPAYTILAPKEDTDSLFFSYLFKLPEMIHVFYRHSQGLVSDTWNLKYNHFRKIVWKVPPKTEQSAIAKILLASDFEINALKARVDCLKHEKKALMQQLLTGKRRVHVDAEAA